jgi:hypothetical protein
MNSERINDSEIAQVCSAFYDGKKMRAYYGENGVHEVMFFERKHPFTRGEEIARFKRIPWGDQWGWKEVATQNDGRECTVKNCGSRTPTSLYLNLRITREERTISLRSIFRGISDLAQRKMERIKG